MPVPADTCSNCRSCSSASFHPELFSPVNLPKMCAQIKGCMFEPDIPKLGSWHGRRGLAGKKPGLVPQLAMGHFNLVNVLGGSRLALQAFDGSIKWLSLPGGGPLRKAQQHPKGCTCPRQIADRAIVLLSPCYPPCAGPGASWAARLSSRRAIRTMCVRAFRTCPSTVDSLLKTPHERQATLALSSQGWRPRRWHRC